MIEQDSYWRPAPPLLLGTGLLLWGWQNNFLLYAVLMGVILEMAGRVTWRWPVSDKEFNNLTDLSGLIFFIVIVYIFFDKGAVGIYTILSIIPFVLFLLVVVQLYSEQGSIRLSTLFVSLRKLEAGNPELSRRVDISLPYFIICITSASAGNIRTIWFFLLCCLLFAITLWFLRPVKRYRMLYWVFMIVVSFCIAFTLQTGISNLQASIERNFLSIFDNFMWRFRDPDRATTAIGSIGRLKLSDRILIRIKTDSNLTEPLYLFEASYNSYNYGVWSAVNPVFSAIDPDPGGHSWTLNENRSDKTAELSVYMVKQAGVIPLPQGSSKINGKGIVAINRNNYGTIKMEMREGWVRYSTSYQERRISLPPPNDYDLSVKDTYRADFEKYADQLHLKGKSKPEIVETITRNFLNNYTYSLTRKQQFPRGRYLADFLFNSKSGHCEFFATATVLLLRTVGIPARYAVGYATQEYSSLEGQYVARSRDAHSWALAFINGRWIPVDTTPSVWAPEEAEHASAFQPLIDLFSWISFKISRWRTSGDLNDDSSSNNLLWLLIPLVLILFWRMYFKERIQRTKGKSEVRTDRVFQGRDSAFYLVVERLTRLGYVRRGDETLLHWISGIDHLVPGKKLLHAAVLHYRYRFDPAGLQERSKQELHSLVGELMSELNSQLAQGDVAGKHII